MPSQQVRAYIYRILIAAGAVVGFYGIMSANEIATWIGFAGVALNVLPAANTPTDSK